jgi:hypothetical protein
MSDTLSDDHVAWTQSFTGVDLAQPDDPNAGQPNQSVDPNVGQPNQSVDPNAGQPNQSVEPNAEQSNQSVDPNAEQPSQADDPNAGASNSTTGQWAVDTPVQMANSGDPYRDPAKPPPDPPPYFPEAQPPKGWPSGQPWPPTGPQPEGWPSGEPWPPGPLWPSWKPWPVKTPEPDTPPSGSDGATTKKVLEVLLVLGVSIALVATVVAALADPEPATKLGLAGLTIVEIEALGAALGFKTSSGPSNPDGA